MDPLDVPSQKADTFPGVLLRTVRKITTHPWEPTVQGRAGGGRGWGAEPGVHAELRARTHSPSGCGPAAGWTRMTSGSRTPVPSHGGGHCMRSSVLCPTGLPMRRAAYNCQQLRPQPGHHHPTDRSLARGPSACMSGASSFFSCCLNSPHVTATPDILEQMSPAHTGTMESAVEVPGYVSF